MATEYVPISDTEQLMAGDVVRIWYRSIGLKWATATQLAAVESRLEGTEEFIVLRHSYPQNSRFYFDVKIKPKTLPDNVNKPAQQANVITGARIAAAIIGAGAILGIAMFSYVGIEKAVETTKEITKGPMGWILAAIVGGVAWRWFKGN